jgi:hypothetical protein
MKNIAIKLLIGYIGVILLVIFIPMKNLYFLAQDTLQKKQIFINQTRIDSFLVNTSLEQTKIYFEDIPAMYVEDISLSLWLLYNSFSLEDIKIDEGLKDFLPLNIKDLSLSYSILYPTKAFISGDGDFGVLNGHIDLIGKVVHLELDASKIMKKSFKKLLGFMRTKKDKNQKNRYIYEYRF